MADITWVSETPLHTAAYEGSLSDVRQLLNQGANVNATATVRPQRNELTPPESEGVSPLHIAALNPDASIAGLFLDRGANIEATSTAGWTPLLWAAIYGNEDVAVVLLQRGANTEPSDDARGFTPLPWAVANNDPGMVRILLDRGADAQATDKQGNIPCQEGLNRGYPQNTRFMERLCLGYTPPPPVESLEWFTETPLHRAAYEGSRSDVESLLDQGADIHATANIAVDGHR